MGHVVGLDIDGARACLVEGVASRGRLQIHRLATLRWSGTTPPAPETMVAELLEWFKAIGIKRQHAMVAMPGTSAFVRRASVLLGRGKRLADMVSLEARQAIPFELEEVAWDWVPLDDSDPTVKQKVAAEASILLVAVKQGLVDRRCELFGQVGLRIEEVDIRPMALRRLAAYQGYIGPDRRVLMLEVGAHNTELGLSDGNQLWVRSLPLGVELLPDEEDSPVELLIDEVEKSLRFYAMELGVGEDVVKINRLLLVGEHAKTLTLSETLARRFQVKPDLLDPLANCGNTDKLWESGGGDLGPRSAYACAVGLALRGVVADDISINLVRGAAEHRQRVAQSQRYGVLSAIVALGLVGMSVLPRGGGLEGLEQRQASLREQVAEARRTKPKIEALVEQHITIHTRVMQVLTLVEARALWLDVLGAVSQATPFDVWMTHVDGQGFDRLINPKPRLLLRGRGTSYESVNRFLSQLKLAERFQSIKPLSSSVIRNDQGGEQVEFTVTMEVTGLGVTAEEAAP